MKPGQDELAEARLRHRQRELRLQVEEAGGARAPTPSELNQSIGGLKLGRPRKDDPMKELTIRLPLSILAKLKATAEIRGMKPSVVAREVIEAWLRGLRRPRSG